MSMRYLFFTADWCKACHATRPVLMERARQSGLDLEVFDVGHAPYAAVAGRLLVRSLPTLIVLDDHRVVEMLVGTDVLKWEP